MAYWTEMAPEAKGGSGMAGESRPAAPKAPAADAALRLLTFLAAQRSPVPAARASAELGLPRSTTYDLLATLVQHGYALHLPHERQYAIGPKAYEVASAYARHAPLARVGRRIVERMVDAAGESGHLGSLQGGDVLYLVEERAKNRPSLVTDIGVRLPAHLTATGRAMLAALPSAHLRTLYSAGAELAQRTEADAPRTVAQLHAQLDEARRDGVAWERGEVTDGMVSVGAAVLDQAGWPVAALSLTWDGASVTPEKAQSCAALVRRAADDMARVISGRRPG
ncbi:IclR family transcriptional regulator [Brachybacterium timonense]|uniref:IclR family transcriptional regulator n=1 Tax=Brachybacterium timonense TaxID=2050896 RepID=UPI001FEB4A40|nr:IclR family transcriptional regulator [Brachybacterium timonense]